VSSRLSGLSTRGRCLLAGGLATAACSLVLAERDLLRAGAFVALMPALGLLLAARTRRRIRVARTVVPARVGVGGEVTVTLDLHGATLVGSLRVADGVPDAAGPVAAAPPRFTVHRLSARGGARLAYPLRPRMRGMHTLGPATTTVSDPLGLAEFAHRLEGSTRLVVLPRVVPLRGLPPALSGDGTAGAALTHQGQGTSDVLVREYRQGDELRRVHWRSTARHDELMVRLEERPWRAGTTVLLDRRDAAHRGRGPDASIEYAISAAASIAAHLQARGEPVTLVTEDGSALAAGVPGLDPLLDALAALRPSARADLAGADLPATDVIAVLGACTPEQVTGLHARRGSAGLAVLLDVATWDPAGGRADVAAAASTLRQAGWAVAVARAGDDVDRVWDALCAARVGVVA
jgi:uncharacterized protein (DUF58 family)